MFWLKLKKSLGLIRTKKFEQIVLFNKIRSSGLFDEQWYLQKYPDVKQSKINPIHHYLTFGWREGRNPSTNFNNNAYLTDYPDVASANICPLLHYINCGKLEGRYIHKLPIDTNNQTTSKNVKTSQTIKQKIKYSWEYPVRVHNEYHRLKDEIKKVTTNKR